MFPVPTRRARVFAVGAGVALFAGCLPIPNTIALSPTVSGTLERSDHSPIVGERLALSVEYNDPTCAKPALHTTTDSAGRFTFPAIEKRERFTTVLFERLFYYSICGGLTAADEIYQVRFLHRVPEADSLTCLGTPAASGEERRSVMCAPRRGG